MNLIDLTVTLTKLEIESSYSDSTGNTTTKNQIYKLYLQGQTRSSNTVVEVCLIRSLNELLGLTKRIAKLDKENELGKSAS